MKILFIGDIVGKVGRKALKINLEKIVKKFKIDFVIANGENISRGRGMNENHYHFLIDNGVDCITLGNHYKDRGEIKEYIDLSPNIVRPLNLKNDFGGSGSLVFDVNGTKVRVTNVLGEAFMKEEVFSPIDKLHEIIKNDESDIHIIDFHAESTGEKKAYAYALSGMVSAILGTHTHVQTNDACILNGEIFFISDVGMCGSYNGVLGVEKDSVIERIVYKNQNSPFKYLDDDDAIFNAVVLEFDDRTYAPQNITTINLVTKKGEKNG